jgi:hypothetical protein
MAYIGKQPVVGNFQVCDAISVVNGQAAYTMQVASTDISPQSANHMLVSLNGVLQKPGSSYTVSGATITFASNLVTNDVIDFIQVLGDVLNTGTPSDGAVLTAGLAANAVTGAKLNTDVISAQTALAAEPADTDEFLVSDAGVLKRIDYSLIKGGGGLIHLQTQTISSGVASVDFTSNIDSTYASYKLVVSDMRVATDNVEVKIRLGAGSFASANYARAGIGRESNGTTNTGNADNNANGIYLTTVNLGSDADESLSFECILANPSNTDAHKLLYGTASYLNQHNRFAVFMFGGHYNADTAAVTRMQVITDSGNIDGGVFTLFGISKG